MAIVQLGQFVTGIRGSIGGNTYQKNGAGTIIRTRSNPRSTSTINQQLSHQRHQKRLVAWSGLALSDRQQWNAYASLYPKQNKFGVSKRITGQNWFESVNSNLEIIGQPLLTLPPIHDLPNAVNTFGIIFIHGQLFISFDQPQDATNDTLLIWATPITSRSTLSVNQIRRLIGITGGGVIGGFSIGSMYANTFPGDSANIPLAVNKQIIVCIQTVHNTSGISSPLLCSFALLNATPPTVDDDNFYYYAP